VIPPPLIFPFSHWDWQRSPKISITNEKLLIIGLQPPHPDPGPSMSKLLTLFLLWWGCTILFLNLRTYPTQSTISTGHNSRNRFLKRPFSALLIVKLPHFQAPVFPESSKATCKRHIMLTFATYPKMPFHQKNLYLSITCH
jgi:hypothetical protein